MEESQSRVLNTLQSAGNLKAFSILLKKKWTALPLNLRTSIRAVLQSPSLTEVDLMDCNFGLVSNLDALLRQCSGLKRVKLSRITFYYNEVNIVGENLPHPQHRDRTRLECLTLLESDTSFITSWVLHPRAAVDVTGLRKLRSSIAPARSSEFALFEKFLGMVGSSLEHLHMEFIYGSIHRTYPCINVNHHHLRSLRLSFDVASYLNPLPWLIDCFSQIKSDSIRELVLDLRVDKETSPRETFLSLPWDHLDIALNKSTFHLLQNVDVTLVSGTRYVLDPGAVDSMRGLLPRLGNRGILSVYNFVYDKSLYYCWPGPTWHASD